MNEFKYVRQAFLEESETQKKCCTKEKLKYDPDFYLPNRSPNTIAANVRVVTDKKVTLQFWGWELVLLENGTYFINDTSGG